MGWIWMQETRAQMIKRLGKKGVVGSFAFIPRTVRDHGMVASGRVELYTMYT
jgi:hypothetical protein